jgi:hypothetical protein
MSKKSVFCIATSRNQADQIVEQLKTANFSNNSISALFADKGTSHDFAHEKNTKAPGSPAHGFPYLRYTKRRWPGRTI